MKTKIGDIDLQDIYMFMETGDASNAPVEIQEYLLLIDRVHKMHLRVLQFGNKESIFKHLEIVDGFSRYQSDKIYNEMLEYYYSDKILAKGIYRNMYAQGMEDLITFSKINAKSVEDAARITSMYEKLGKMRQLDLVDPPSFPKELLQKPIKIYAMEASFLGEEKINRTALARQIDELEDYTTNEKLLLRQDAGLDQIQLFNNEQEESRKSDR